MSTGEAGAACCGHVVLPGQGAGVRRACRSRATAGAEPGERNGRQPPPARQLGHGGATSGWSHSSLTAACAARRHPRPPEPGERSGRQPPAGAPCRTHAAPTPDSPQLAGGPRQPRRRDHRARASPRPPEPGERNGLQPPTPATSATPARYPGRVGPRPRAHRPPTPGTPARQPGHTGPPARAHRPANPGTPARQTRAQPGHTGAPPAHHARTSGTPARHPDAPARPGHGPRQPRPRDHPARVSPRPSEPPEPGDNPHDRIVWWYCAG